MFRQAIGKNYTGQIVAYYRSTGFKKYYRLIDFFRILWNISALILQFEYDPYRNCFIALICYENGIYSYILATENLKIGQRIFIGYNKYFKFKNLSKFFFKYGNVLYLKQILDGSMIHLLEHYKSFKLKYIRAAGCSAKLLRQVTLNISILRFPSKEQYLFYSNSICTLGQISNLNKKFLDYKNAGIKRRLGFRPKVRGVAKNPIDHPHGGGEGKSSGGQGRKSSVNRWSRVAKGKPSRKDYQTRHIFKTLFIYLSRKDKSIRHKKK